MCPKELRWGQKGIVADCVHNISHTSWEVEGAQCLLVDINKEWSAYTNRIFLSLKGEKCSMLQGGWSLWGHNTQWNIEFSNKRWILCDSTYRRSLESQIHADRKRWSRAGDLWCHAQTTWLGKMRWLWRWRLSNSCITMWMNVVYLNCAPKNAQNGRFYVVCVFTTNF